MVSCPLVNSTAENNKTANAVLPDLVHRLYQGMIFLWSTNKHNLIYAHNISMAFSASIFTNSPMLNSII
jgi:hypothetical protein